MAFDKYKNGAWQEPESGVRRYDTDKTAWVDCESAKRYVDGAWKEVWSAMKCMKELYCSSDITAYYLQSSSKGKYGWSVNFANTPNADYATYYLEGEFVNPTFSFEYEGAAWLTEPNGDVAYRPAGKLYVYTRTTDGTEEYTAVSTSLGTTSGPESGTYDKALSGAYDRIGFKVVASPAYSSSVDVTKYIDISYPYIDGKLALPGKECIQ